MSLLSAINRHMHEGRCPTAGSLGECAAIWLESSSETAAHYGAAVYLWSAAAGLKYAEVARWFQEASGCNADDVLVHATMHDPYNETHEGACSDGARPLYVSFSVELARAAELGLPLPNAEAVAAKPAAPAPMSRQQLREAFYTTTGCTLGNDIGLAESVCIVVEQFHGIRRAGA